MDPFRLFTHHKCASTWALSYLEQFCLLNDLKFRFTHHSAAETEADADVQALINADHPYISQFGFEGVHLIRNPFSILASAYYSHLKTHPTDIWPQLVIHRKILRTSNLHDGYLLTLAFLEREDFDAHTIGPFLALRRWDWKSPAYTTMRMEDCVKDVKGTLGLKLQEHFGAGVRLPPPENFTFAAFAGDRPVDTVKNDSHYRSPDQNRWAVELPSSAIEYVATNFVELLSTHYPDHLVRAKAPVYAQRSKWRRWIAKHRRSSH